MRKALLALPVCVLALAIPVLAQGPPMPTPGPEHAMLGKDVGTWDATVEMFMPGAPPSATKGTEVVTMMGGFWQLTEFKSEMMGQPFEGRGTMSFDPAKKKYVGTWVDTMAPAYYTVEGTYDAATKTLTGWMEGPDPTGVVSKTKETTEWKDADNRVFTMYAPDGKAPLMKITYKRRK